MKNLKLRHIPLAALLLVLAAMFLRWQYAAPLAFNAERWARGDEKLRYRMKDSLIAKHRAGELSTVKSIERLLGPDHDQLAHSRHYALETWIGVPWYLRIRFDDAGRVIYFNAHPD